MNITEPDDDGKVMMVCLNHGPIPCGELNPVTAQALKDAGLVEIVPLVPIWTVSRERTRTPTDHARLTDAGHAMLREATILPVEVHSILGPGAEAKK